MKKLLRFLTIFIAIGFFIFLHCSAGINEENSSNNSGAPSWYTNPEKFPCSMDRCFTGASYHIKNRDDSLNTARNIAYANIINSFFIVTLTSHFKVDIEAKYSGKTEQEKTAIRHKIFTQVKGTLKGLNVLQEHCNKVRVVQNDEVYYGYNCYVRVGIKKKEVLQQVAKQIKQTDKKCLILNKNIKSIKQLISSENPGKAINLLHDTQMMTDNLLPTICVTGAESDLKILQQQLNDSITCKFDKKSNNKMSSRKIACFYKNKTPISSVKLKISNNRNQPVIQGISDDKGKLIFGNRVNPFKATTITVKISSLNKKTDIEIPRFYTKKILLITIDTHSDKSNTYWSDNIAAQAMNNVFGAEPNVIITFPKMPQQKHLPHSVHIARININLTGEIKKTIPQSSQLSGYIIIKYIGTLKITGQDIAYSFPILARGLGKTIEITNNTLKVSLESQLEKKLKKLPSIF